MDTRVPIQSGPKSNAAFPPPQWWFPIKFHYDWSTECRHTARRQIDWYTLSSPLSLRLRWAIIKSINRTGVNRGLKPALWERSLIIRQKAHWIQKSIFLMVRLNFHTLSVYCTSLPSIIALGNVQSFINSVLNFYRKSNSLITWQTPIAHSWLTVCQNLLLIDLFRWVVLLF